MAATSTPPPASRPGAATAPGFVYSALRVFDISIGEMLWSRRTIFMLLVVGLPVFGALCFRAILAIGGPSMVARLDITGPAIFGLMIWGAFVRFSVPVLGVFYGTALIADEVEDKTITYLFTRPIPRGAVLAGKYLAYLACTLCVVLPSVVLVWLLVVPVNGSLGANFPDLVTDLALIAIGLAVYGAVFALIGCTLKRPLLFGLVFIFGWETVVLAIPGYLKRFSVAFYVQGLVPHAMPSSSIVDDIQEIMREIPSLSECFFWMTVIEVACLWLAMRAVSRKEYVLEQ